MSKATVVLFIRQAIQIGNVGCLEDLITKLIIYIKGHENVTYAQELAEYMQWMRYDAPPGIRQILI
jgi:hypothetical protein